MNKETIYKQEGRLYMTVLNNIRHRLLRMDVDSTLRTGFLHVKVLEDSLPRSIFGFAYVNDTAFLCRTITNDETQQLRFYMENGRKRTPPHLEKLNEARIDKGGDFNYLSSIVKFNRERQMFVEASVAMNHINLYTYDGSKTRTICVGEKLDDIDELQRLPGWKMPYTYEHLCIYPRFFAALYLGTTKKAFQTRTGHMPKIHIFDWEGAPLAEVELHHYATSFDIDFTARELYVLDPETEDFYRYEIKELLTAIERVN